MCFSSNVYVKEVWNVILFGFAAMPETLAPSALPVTLDGGQVVTESDGNPMTGKCTGLSFALVATVV